MNSAIESHNCKIYSNLNQNKIRIDFLNNNLGSNSTNLQKELVGGSNKEWKNIVKKICQKYVERKNSQTDVKEIVKRPYETKKSLDVEKLNNPYLLRPNDYKTQEELFNAIKHWWIFKYRKKESTIKERLRYAKKNVRTSNISN